MSFDLIHEMVLDLIVNVVNPEVEMKEKMLPYIDGLHVLPWLTDGAIV